MLFRNLGDHAAGFADADMVLKNDAENVDTLHFRAAAMSEHLKPPFDFLYQFQ